MVPLHLIAHSVFSYHFSLSLSLIIFLFSLSLSKYLYLSLSLSRDTHTHTQTTKPVAATTPPPPSPTAPSSSKTVAKRFVQDPRLFRIRNPEPVLRLSYANYGHEGRTVKRIKRKILKSKSDEKIAGFSSYSLFSARKREAVTRVEPDG